MILDMRIVCFWINLQILTTLAFLLLPIKKIKISKHKSRKPWVSKGLLKSKKKNNLYRKYMNQPCIPNENNYKTFKNKLNHLLRIAKRMYYEKQLERVKTNTKNTWKILNEVINRKKVTNRLYC